MAFDKYGLQPLGGQSRIGAAPQAWSYRTTDGATDVDTDGYFNPIRTLLVPGDTISRVTVDGNGALVSAGTHLVRAVPSTGNVSVTDTTALVTTNTD